ncbi:MAG: class I SAM-dependent methyltransferase [Lachnospiraceae bacterium]|nr:class I SAM-dependent methyltransferase [Lachnospiraceae bacterium]
MFTPDETIAYYNLNAQKFISDTVCVDFEATRKTFTDKLPVGASILDFGCGSGRDTKHFLAQSFQVDASDGSLELCKLASEYTGIHVKSMRFEELSAIEAYDGIWACSSILHLPYHELTDVMRKMTVALKNKGIIYTSFKYGTFEGERNGRYFLDMTEETFAAFLAEIEGLTIEEQWLTFDVRPNRGEERWLNLILRKL